MMNPVRKELFWDIDGQSADLNIHKQLIIERVLSLGNVNEFRFILKHYKTDEIINAIKQAGYFDPKTLSFVLTFFHLDKEDLKCCTRKQSAETHWN